MFYDVSTEITITDVIVANSQLVTYDYYAKFILFGLVVVCAVLAIHNIFKKIRGVE